MKYAGHGTSRAVDPSAWGQDMMKNEQHQAGAAQWLYARFERDTRYYELRLQQDLFGWVVIKVWQMR